MHTVPQQPEVVRDLLRSCSRGRTAGPPHNVLVLLQQAVDKQTMHIKLNVKQATREAMVYSCDLTSLSHTLSLI